VTKDNLHISRTRLFQKKKTMANFCAQKPFENFCAQKPFENDDTTRNTISDF